MFCLVGSRVDEYGVVGTGMGNEPHHQSQVVHIDLIIAFWNAAPALSALVSARATG